MKHLKTLLAVSLCISSSAFALQGHDFGSIQDANNQGAKVGWDVETDGGLVLKGDNDMESTLTVSNTRDAGGARAPVLKVQGRNEKKNLNTALPILSVESVENQAGIELTDGSMKGDAKLGWSIIYDGKEKSELILREIRGSGNWIVTSFYRLENKMIQAAPTDGSTVGQSFLAKVFVPYCPKNSNGDLAITQRDKESFPTCPQ